MTALISLLFVTSFVFFNPSLAFAAATEMPPLVYDIGISIFIASILAIVFVRLKIPSIAAFLLSGILIGPIGLRLITHPENIDTIAKLGFILLLFMIGMEIDLRRMLRSGKMIIIMDFCNILSVFCLAFSLLRAPFGSGFQRD